MHDRATRRAFCLGALAAACGGRREPPRAAGAQDGAEALAAIERRIGGRLGVAVLDTETGWRLAYRDTERFAMCSTFKWLLVAQVLARVDAGELSLDARVALAPEDLLEHAPAAREHLAQGHMTIDALARACVVVSDNTAANLLLAQLGGPAALTAHARSLGDATTRLDRIEPELNQNAPGDERDTTTPRAMLDLMQRVLCGTALSAASRERLIAWLRACETGRARLRAGLPEAWAAGDKTGTGMNGSCNDVAIAFPPRRAPLLITTYTSDGPSPLERLQAAHADVAKLVASQVARERLD